VSARSGGGPWRNGTARGTRKKPTCFKETGALWEIEQVKKNRRHVGIFALQQTELHRSRNKRQREEQERGVFQEQNKDKTVKRVKNCLEKIGRTRKFCTAPEEGFLFIAFSVEIAPGGEKPSREKNPAGVKCERRNVRGGEGGSPDVRKCLVSTAS